jgi:GTP cyclohydrolase II
MIIKIAEGSLKTKFGEYHEIIYYDGQKESIALILGDVEGAEEVLCRVHSSCIAAHNFNSVECDCREQMEISQRLIEKEKKGVIVWLEQKGKTNGHFALLKSKEHKNLGLSQEADYEAAGFKKDARDFSKAAEILNEIGVKSIRILTNNPEKTKTFSRHGVNVVGTKRLTIKLRENTYMAGKSDS